jgi:hypothetical protein
VDGRGNVVVSGNIGTVKYAGTDGTLLWEQRYSPMGNEHFYYTPAVAVDGHGNVLVTLNSHCDGTGSGSEYYYYTAKYAAADGALLWEKRSDSGGPAVAADRAGDVVVSGYSYNGTNIDYYTAKYAAVDGALLWEKNYNGPANGQEASNRGGGLLGCEFERTGRTSRSLALGPNGMIAITGFSEGNHDSVTTADYATVVYRENLPPVSIALVPTGIRLRFTGIPDSSYTIERAPAVTGPWTTINRQTAPASGLVEYIDATPPSSQAFYRTVLP